ncbi:hypothetical protein ACIOG4_27735 [Streptomyces microflavus]|uniref:hypothetical protein n=1 Tax=Streptomyces microflavus TaxID=1919 RepID=UPI003812EA0D
MTPRRIPGAVPEHRRTTITASVELPLAQHILPAGLVPSVYERFNRVRKSVATAYYLHISHHGMLDGNDIAALTQRQMTTAARSAGVEPPNSDDSRALVRQLLRVFNGIDAPAAERPAATGPKGTRVTRDELAHSLDSLAVVIQAAAQGVTR